MAQLMPGKLASSARVQMAVSAWSSVGGALVEGMSCRCLSLQRRLLARVVAACEIKE